MVTMAAEEFKQPETSLLGSMLRFSIGFMLLAVMSIFILFALILFLPSRVARIRICNFYGKVIGRGITALAGVKPNIVSRERIYGNHPAIFVGNHASTLDLFLSIWLCPFGGVGVMKKEITRVPFFGQIALLSGHLLLDRNNHGKAVDALRRIAEVVKKYGVSIWMMPEGTRARDGRLLPFKKGFVHLAIASGLPVVPVIIHGAHKNWVAGKFRFHPMTVDIEILEKIDTSNWKEETAGEHAASVHAIFVQKLRDDQKPLNVPAAPILAQPVTAH
jgi:1-acyl-sn-glycerol-3-phosphate acyltransferase